MSLRGEGNWPHFVYRCYDAEDRLLYIGCTQDVVSRMGVHRSSWGNRVSAYLNLRMTRYTTEEHPSRSAGRKAEREAIAAEAPILNTLHNKGRGTIPPLNPTSSEYGPALRAVAELFTRPLADTG